MIDISDENIVKLSKCYDVNVEKMANNVRDYFSKNGGEFSIFTIFAALNTKTIIHDDDNKVIARYLSFSGDEYKNYLVLSAGRTIEEMRFDASCMLKELLNQVNKKGKNFCLNFTTLSKGFNRESKHFACALLMPENELMSFIKRKDENGNYLYLENNNLSFKNIHVIADHFGVPFDQCSSRIFHVFESLKNGKYTIENCKNKREYEDKKHEYSEEERENDRNEVIKDHKINRERLISHLIDSLHYRSWSELTQIAQRKLLVNLVKYDSVNEGVVKNEIEANKIINNYIASGGKIIDGVLITSDNEYGLSDEQLVVIGEFELYEATLRRGLIRGVVRANPHLNDILNMDYESAINHISERDLTYYFRDLHERLFHHLSDKYGEKRGGDFRSSSVKLKGTDIEVASPRMIPQIMDNLSWRLLDILKRNVNGKLSNSEYMREVNSCIYEMIRSQPFVDGNKRTARLISNIFYQEKGLPYVIVPVKDWDNYVNAWSSNDMNEYNSMMNRLVIDSYQYFYGNQSTNKATLFSDNGKKIITSKKKSDR